MAREGLYKISMLKARVGRSKARKAIVRIAEFNFMCINSTSANLPSKYNQTTPALGI
jgi:hypothetical protein